MVGACIDLGRPLSDAQREGDAVVVAVLVREAEARPKRNLGAHDAVAAVKVGGLHRTVVSGH